MINLHHLWSACLQRATCKCSEGVECSNCDEQQSGATAALCFPQVEIRKNAFDSHSLARSSDARLSSHEFGFGSSSGFRSFDHPFLCTLHCFLEFSLIWFLSLGDAAAGSAISIIGVHRAFPHTGSPTKPAWRQMTTPQRQHRWLQTTWRRNARSD